MTAAANAPIATMARILITAVSWVFLQMSRLLERSMTVWLIAQIILPFTAPFPVCDASDLFGGAVRHANATPAHWSNVPRGDGAYAYAPPLRTVAGRPKLVPLRASHDADRAYMRVVFGRHLLLTESGYRQQSGQRLILRL